MAETWARAPVCLFLRHFDSYPDSPMLGDTADTDREFGCAFATAVAEFLTSPEVTDWAPYATGQIRHLGPRASSW